MKTQKRNLSKEFKALLNGRSILDLRGDESVKATELLTEIVKSKPLKKFTKTEVKALVEELTNYIAANMFKCDEPDNWKEEMLDNILNSDEREWGFCLASILDFYLHDIEMWDELDADESEVVAKTIIKYLEGQDYYDYFKYYLEKMEQN